MWPLNPKGQRIFRRPLIALPVIGIVLLVGLVIVLAQMFYEWALEPGDLFDE